MISRDSWPRYAVSRGAAISAGGEEQKPWWRARWEAQVTALRQQRAAPPADVAPRRWRRGQPGCSADTAAASAQHTYSVDEEPDQEELAARRDRIAGQLQRLHRRAARREERQTPSGKTGDAPGVPSSAAQTAGLGTAAEGASVQGKPGNRGGPRTGRSEVWSQAAGAGRVVEDDEER